MRGSIANAVDAVGGIKEFLADQVPDADPDDQTPGQPKFASLQDMLAALDTAAYADSGLDHRRLGDGARRPPFDPTTKKVSFTVRTTRGGVNDRRAERPRRRHDRQRPPTAPPGLTATGVDLNGPEDATGAALAGRRVTAGTRTARSRRSPTRQRYPHRDGWSGGSPPTAPTSPSRPPTRRPVPRSSPTPWRLTTGIKAANAEPVHGHDDARRRPRPADGARPERAADLRRRHRNDRPDCDPEPGHRPLPVPAGRHQRARTGHHLASARERPRAAAPDARAPCWSRTPTITSPVQITHDERVPRPDHRRLGRHSASRAASTCRRSHSPDSGDIPVPAFVEQVRQQAVRSAPSVRRRLLPDPRRVGRGHRRRQRRRRRRRLRRRRGLDRRSP